MIIPSTPAELLAAMERCGRATSGPWEAVHNPRHEESRIYSGLTQRAMFDGRLLLGERDDCEFSAKARTDVPAQLALIAELLDVIEELADNSGCESRCQSNSTMGPHRCDCGYPEARAKADKFTASEYRDVAQKLRGAR